jgi:hypothetical protein
MKPPKPDKPKTTNDPEERFYRFAKALIAVPKKELDRELSKYDRTKTKRKPVKA